MPKLNIYPILNKHYVLFLLLLYLIIRVRHRYPDRIYKEIGNVRCWHRADRLKYCKVFYERSADITANGDNCRLR